MTTQETTQKELDALLETITGGLKKKEEVTLQGFGKFKISERSARKGRNPKTGETIDIAASCSPTFSAGIALKDAVN